MTTGTPRWLFLPFAAMVALAGVLGFRMGQPLSETDIINHFAAVYLAQAGNGAAPTDCLAIANPDPAIRLVVVCTHPGGAVYQYPVGPRGRLIAPASDTHRPAI